MDAAAHTPLDELRPTLERLRTARRGGKRDPARRRAVLQRVRGHIYRPVQTMEAACRAVIGEAH